MIRNARKLNIMTRKLAITLIYDAIRNRPELNIRDTQMERKNIGYMVRQVQIGRSNWSKPMDLLATWGHCINGS